MATRRATRLRAELARCTDVDGVARVVLEDLLTVPDVVRAGIALVAPGRREHHFLPSDPDRLRAQPEWCLIDAYDDLPLNDCIRTGRAISHGDPADLARAYPALAKAQSGTAVRSVVAVPLGSDQGTLGGLLLYYGVDLTGDSALQLVLELAEVVGEALLAVRPAAEWPPAEGLVLPADETAPSVARHWLVEALGDLHVALDVVDAAVVCTSELVTNVVIHTGRPSVVTLEHDSEEIVVRLQHLTDPSPRRILRPEDADPLRISGHGLDLVEALSAGWGSDERDGVTTVWCRFDR
jgi:anti-sigma regulatory factor (Ser/Thr protein kinase)